MGELVTIVPVADRATIGYDWSARIAALPTAEDMAAMTHDLSQTVEEIIFVGEQISSGQEQGASEQTTSQG